MLFLRSRCRRVVVAKGDVTRDNSQQRFLAHHSVATLLRHWVRFLGKIQIRQFLNPKTDFAFFWTNPKTDHESIKSTLRVDSSDQIQIRIFEIHNLNVSWGKDLKKVFLTSGFLNKNGTQQVPYMYDILTEPILLAISLQCRRFL